MMCNALDANDLLDCGAISLPVSEMLPTVQN